MLFNISCYTELQRTGKRHLPLVRVNVPMVPVASSRVRSYPCVALVVRDQSLTICSAAGLLPEKQIWPRLLPGNSVCWDVAFLSVPVPVLSISVSTTTSHLCALPAKAATTHPCLAPRALPKLQEKQLSPAPVCFPCYVWTLITEMLFTFS